MRQSIVSELARRNRYNLHILRQSPAAEISGALGDLGTLLPIMVALALQGSIDLPATLIFSGLFNIVTGVVFGIPLPVQPMKAIAASVLTSHFSLPVTAGAGALVGLAVLFLSLTGLLRLLTSLIPRPIISGIQLGAGLRLVSSGANLILPLAWLTPTLNSRVSALLVFALLLLTQRARAFPSALLLFVLGLAVSFCSPLVHPSSVPPPPSPASLSLHLPALTSPLALTAALAQLPLTTLNSILAVSALAASLFPPSPPAPNADPNPSPNRNSDLPPPPPPSPTSLGLSLAAMNLLSAPLGAMPMCHGAGGLAAQHRFGARSGASVVVLGTAKLLLGVFVRGGAVLDVLKAGVPAAWLGVMVVVSGLELGRVGCAGVGGAVGDGEGEGEGEGEGDDETGRKKGRAQEEKEKEEAWMVMLVTAAGTLAFGSDAVGFLAGCGCFVSYRIADRVESRGGWAQVGRGRGPGRGVLGGERRPLLGG